MSSAELIILLIVVFGLAGFNFVMQLFVAHDTTRIPVISNKLMNVEKLLSDAEKQSATELWKTSDGKYEAESFEDLVIKMAEDPDGPFTTDEKNAIESIFKKISGEIDGDSEPKW